MFSCPNPACTHSFSPAAIKGASQFTCPKCGTVFRFAASLNAAPSPPSAPKKPPQAPPPRPASPPVASVPIAQPVAAPQVPLAAPVEAAPSAPNLDFASSPAVVAPQSRQRANPTKSQGGLRWIVFAVVGVFGVALAVWGGLWLKHLFKLAQSDDPAHSPSVYNARFALPGKPWQRDKEIQLNLHVHIGMKSADNKGMALLFKDYKTRMPSEAEMFEEARSRLNAYFQGLEWERKEYDSARLAGHPAQVIAFQGNNAEQVTLNGECYMMAFRGYGYWFFTWAPLSDLQQNDEAIHADWARLRDRLKLDNGRKGWQERPRETVPLVGKKANYRLAYVKGLWTPEAVDDADAQLDLWLTGQYPKDPDEKKPPAGKNATVQVFVLPKQGDLKEAAKAALAFVKEREQKLYPAGKWETIKDKNGDVDRTEKIGAVEGHLTKLHVTSTDDLERYLLLAVVNRADGVVLLLGDCLWERHDFWDQELMVLLATFKAKGR